MHSVWTIQGQLPVPVDGSQMISLFQILIRFARDPSWSVSTRLIRMRPLRHHLSAPPGSDAHPGLPTTSTRLSWKFQPHPDSIVPVPHESLSSLITKRLLRTRWEFLIS